MSRRATLKQRRGFTLIELIVVIGILALLIGMLVPYLSGARRQAKTNVCLSQLKGIGSSLAVYLTENQDQFIAGRLSKSPPSSTELFVDDNHCQAPRWQWFLNKSLGPVFEVGKSQRIVLRIQSQGFFNDDEHVRDTTSVTNKQFICPALTDERYVDDIRHGSYGYNYQYLGNARQDTDPNRWDNFSVGLHKIKAPAATVAMADSRGAGIPHGKGSYLLDPPRLATEQNAKFMGPEDTDLSTGDDPAVMKFSPVEARHNGSGNVVFADAHAQGHTLKDLGYEFNEKGVAIPVLKPEDGTHWNNKFWTGQGLDPLASKRPAPP